MFKFILCLINFLYYPWSSYDTRLSCINFWNYAAQFCHGIPGAVEDDVFDLKFVFMVCVMLRQIPELLGQVKTVLGQFRTDEIFSNFDAIMQVSDLKFDFKYLIRH